MKKALGVAVAAVALSGCLAMAGCSSKAPSGEASNDGGESQQGQEAQKSDAKYQVTIDDCVTTTDYQGNPAIVVTYTWTNNSEEPQMFEVAIDDAAFQNGVELDFATVSVTSEEFDTRAGFNEIKPGATQTVQQAFLLDDQSDVTIECTELISFDDTILAEATFSVV